MVEILIGIAILGGLGLVFGLVLSAASKVFYVETDPRLDQLNECLPGANCGGCGYAGCGGYAEAVLKGEAEIGLCASGGNECAQAMGAIMGIKVGDVARKVALVRCSGYKSLDADGNVMGAKMKAVYEGFHDCVAASKVGGNGPLACKFGCLGFTLAIVLFASIRERVDKAECPESFRGFPITMIAAGLLALAFMGFSGLSIF